MTPRVEAGDLWALGDHRLGCFDATDADNVRRLVGDAKVGMVFADPPYGMRAVNERTGTVGNIYRRGRLPGGIYPPVIGDDSTDTAKRASRLLLDLFPKAAHVWWGGNYYADALPPSSCWIIWDKKNYGFRADGEVAWTNQNSAVRIFAHQWNGLMRASERGQKRVHPTQKPIALAEWCIEKYGQPGAVLDPFCGSGMSVIAGERRGVPVLAAELSPDYCSIIIARWEKETGRTAELLRRAPVALAA